MSKRGKAQNAQRRAAKRTVDPVLQLAAAARLVGDLFGTESHCLEAAGLMIAVGQSMGFDLTPRLVSVVGVSRAAGDVSGFVTGTVAAEAARQVGLPAPTVEPGSNFAVDWAGHAVVILADPPLLLDPNFRQFARAGFPAVSVAMKVRDATPTAGFWEANFGGLASVRYIPDERAAQQHLAIIAGHADTLGAAGTSLADMVRSGVEPDDDSWVHDFLRRQPAFRNVP